MNVNALRDSDNDAGFYAVVTSAGSAWPGATLYQSTDNGASYRAIGTFTSRTTMGRTIDTLGDYASGNTVDESNAIRVSLTYGELSSVTYSNLLEGLQAALIGDEIVYFRDAVLNADRTYTLRGFLRGRRGTEWAMPSHTANDRFVLLTPATVKRITQETADIGKTRLYKVVTSGASMSSAQAQSFKNEGAALKPYAPVLIGGGSDADGNLTITWTRRTRISGEWRDNVDVPLGEASEAYEVEIMDANFTAVKRTFTGLTSPTVTYSAADQAADGIAPTDPVSVQVYQLSSTVGRGYPGRGALRYNGMIMSGGGSGGGSSTGPVAPTLTNPTATQTGTATASGSVTTNLSNGTLYVLFSTNSTATAAQVKAGLSQAVISAGTQYVNVTGLTVSTTYYPHYLHRNSAGLDSAVVTGAGFTTATSGAGTGGGQGAQPIAIGGQIAPLSVENTSASSASNLPFTIGHAFRAGHLPAVGADISLHLPDGTQIDSQIIVKATHGDGSVRHAIISGVVPSIAGSATVPLSMRRATAGAAGSAVPLPSSLPSITLSISGVTWTAAPNGSTPHDTWFAGPVASDYIFNMPFVNGSGNPHPTLTAQFSVRAFKSGHVRVDAVVEHTKAYASIADITYNATISANGNTVYTKTGLVHTPCARWKKSFWYGTAPSLHVKHDTAYLIASRAVPNYDQSIPVSESALSDFAAKLATYDFGPMGFGILNPAMGTTGGRPDIGLMPHTHAAMVLSMDKRAKAIMLASADTGGSWPGCRRDDSTGPGRGLPLSVRNFPYATILGGGSDGINPSTGKNEHLPALSTATHGSIDSSHQPGLFYLPYLLTGDLYYLEGLQFWNAFNIYQSNPNYRLREQGLISPDQVRGQGWSLRTLAECAYVTPDNHPAKADYLYWMDTNINWYNQKYTDGTDNVLGIITGSAFAYNNGRGMAPWQDDFFTSSVAHAVELLGHDGAKRLLYWKAKFQISRFVGAGTCIQEATPYALNVRDSSTSPYYTTIGQCMDATISAEIRSYPCNSAGRLALMSSHCLPGDIDGYPDSPEGYPSNLQPGLAGAVDSGYPGGATAWAMFDARPTKPDYGLEPQFSIVPR